MSRIFADRHQAGVELATLVADRLKDPVDPLVLALPRGGLPVAAPVARQLKAELDLMMVRKLGVPGHEELAMGAIASGGIRVPNQDVIDHYRVSEQAQEEVVRRELRELERRERTYRGDRPPVRIEGRTVVLVDDGVATGSTMLAAARAVRSENPPRLVIAVPVAPPESVAALREMADEVLVVQTPSDLFGIGQFYRRFGQTSDDEVRQILTEFWD